jgi:hypothetical protein
MNGLRNKEEFIVLLVNRIKARKVYYITGQELYAVQFMAARGVYTYVSLDSGRDINICGDVKDGQCSSNWNMNMNMNTGR